jgi:WD40 repeat protein
MVTFRLSSLLMNAGNFVKNVVPDMNLGITTMDISADEYIAGSETGFVFKGKIDSTEGANPVTFQYVAQLGSIQSIAFSPFDLSLFLVASAEGSLCLYSVRKKAPILTWSLDPISAAVWSPTRPCVLACATSNGVFIFDLTVTKCNKAIYQDVHGSHCATGRVYMYCINIQ